MQVELGRLNFIVSCHRNKIITQQESHIDAGMTIVSSGCHTDNTEVILMLLLAAQLAPGSQLGKTATDTEVVVDNTLGFSVSLKNGNDALGFFGNSNDAAGGKPDFDQASTLTCVNYFTMDTDVDTDERTDLFDSPSLLTEFVKNFGSHCSAVFATYTSGAVTIRTAVAHGGIWGVIRSVSMKVMDSKNTILRMMDLNVDKG